ECSHQHFYMMETMSPVEDGSDTALYFSPFRPSVKRPIHAIATSYHACANMVLFYRKLRAAAAQDMHEVDHHLAKFEAYLTAFEAALEQSRGLTARGRTFSNRITDALRADVGAAA
ncbi:MAG: HEXXH motif-containing putative peptide modification protein, partial [Pseudomonadota bacterium]